MQILEQITDKAQLNNKLLKLGLSSWWDLALHIPLRYEDLTRVYPIAEARAGQQVMVEGEIISCEVIQRKNRQLIVKIADGDGFISLLFFHFFPNYASQYKIGKRIRAFGEVKQDHFGNKTIIHPKIQTVNEEVKLSNTFTPIYPTTNGLNNQTIIQLVEDLFNANIISETLPQNIIDRYKLLGLAQALLALHKLTPLQFKQKYQEKALARLKFDELLAQQLLMHKVYVKKHANPAPQLKTNNKYLIPLLAKLPFKLTKAQQKVLREILQDMLLDKQMNRLLQGDVGSGKTIVATIAAVVAIENGFQACIMAPTEILAEQHYLKISSLCEEIGIKTGWLSGSQTKKQKQEAYAAIAAGTIQLIVGTHAVFQKDVEFHNLGLAVIDEQHRFGVEQRLALINKNKQQLYPHQLMMSATPIPRSLAMSYYADLDVSVIDELPPGRTPISTLLINNNRRHEVIEFVRTKIDSGAQVYWVCPLIEESEKLELENALNTYQELANHLAPIKVGLIHGKLKAREKAQVMEEFSQNQLQLLVATTVIEVGVDVPNASIIVIEHSERMGLAQLHQLRGRVGRGNQQSECILLYEPGLTEVARQRLQVISSSTDGFEIARQDLLIRGPGELLGQRQSGLPALRFANLEEDLDILQQIKPLAQEIAEEYPSHARLLTDLWFHNKSIYTQS